MWALLRFSAGTSKLRFQFSLRQARYLPRGHFRLWAEWLPLAPYQPINPCIMRPELLMWHPGAATGSQSKVRTLSSSVQWRAPTFRKHCTLSLSGFPSIHFQGLRYKTPYYNTRFSVHLCNVKDTQLIAWQSNAKCLSSFMLLHVRWKRIVNMSTEALRKCDFQQFKRTITNCGAELLSLKWFYGSNSKLEFAIKRSIKL